MLSIQVWSTRLLHPPRFQHGGATTAGENIRIIV